MKEDDDRSQQFHKIIIIIFFFKKNYSFSQILFVSSLRGNQPPEKIFLKNEPGNISPRTSITKQATKYKKKKKKTPTKQQGIFLFN